MGCCRRLVEGGPSERPPPPMSRTPHDTASPAPGTHRIQIEPPTFPRGTVRLSAPTHVTRTLYVRLLIIDYARLSTSCGPCGDSILSPETCVSEPSGPTETGHWVAHSPFPA